MELARRDLEIARPAEPIPVRAWITAGQSGDMRVDGEAVAWAGRQVHIRYLDGAGREGWAWLWTDAVSRR